MRLTTIPKLGADPDFPLSEKQMRDLVKAGRIPFVKFGNRFMLDPEAVLEALRKELVRK